MLKAPTDELTTEEYIKLCLEYNKEHGEDLTGIPYEYCPINFHAYKKQHGHGCNTIVQGIEYCPICGHAMCPVCKNHNVEQLSRVTGYISSVGGWNDSKKQELKDRQRYQINGEMM